MANIDVTELFSDPDFVDPMTVISRVPMVDSLGQNRLTETSVSSFGSIQPLSGDTVNRIPEALRNENVRSFYFKGVIVTSAPGEYPSIIVFRGKRYQVRHVFDWTNWGQGFTKGLCVAEVPS